MAIDKSERISFNLLQVTCGIQGLSDCVKIKIPAKLGGKPEKIDAIAALAMACVSAIQRGRVVNVGNWQPGGKKDDIKVDASFDVMEVGLPGYNPNY